ncbi:Yhc1p [Saccharomyces cerevisiae x Saccharomyces kudriavzevii VIN7]|uniref:U1 small nuclear ribonucleoprotein C n=1 Tax=Saccharomyces cerevisiae x Saccharomyces kudriavzevii (strain VIN7) TaxID=1095631 RepID=H0GYJ9_SACCK|nr:Yhc1p [Saccharomyces cerevisiae x Saccharomyces kudriavzevii VIN7]
MTRYYCEYCHSYLTHDTLSVRKSHLVGKNHLRITADYYRNKARDISSKRDHKRHHKGKRGRKERENTDANEKLRLTCLSNREKRGNLHGRKMNQKELAQTSINTLQSLYDGSPGYSKVFIDTNRFDIGDLVKASKLPQRANDRSTQHALKQTSRSRDETCENNPFPRLTNPRRLEPPKILSQWSNTIPKTSIFYSTDILQATIKESKKRMHPDGPRKPLGYNGVKRRRYGN